MITSASPSDIRKQAHGLGDDLLGTVTNFIQHEHLDVFACQPL